jgi:hypothetical protein
MPHPDRANTRLFRWKMPIFRAHIMCAGARTINTKIASNAGKTRRFSPPQRSVECDAR